MSDLYPSYLHLDFKGAMPGPAVMLAWIDDIAAMGFDGIVFELEDRIAWHTWPGTRRGGYSHDELDAIIRRCEQHNMALVPLVQSLGHFEWLLKHDRYAPLAESSVRYQICPLHPETIGRITAWIDEVIDLMPSCAMVHIGGDEAWQLGGCARCADAVRHDPHGKAGLYLKHIAALCEHVVSRGRRPMLWADLLLKHDAAALARCLPEATVLVDWNYKPDGPFDGAQILRQSGRTVWGASAVRCSYDRTAVLGPLVDRVDNVLNWHRAAEAGQVSGVIHTTWGRAGGIDPMYGTWEGWLAPMLAAGAPRQWPAHPAAGVLRDLDLAMTRNQPEHLARTQKTLEDIVLSNPRQQRMIEWWRLALDHAAMMQLAFRCTFEYAGMAGVAAHHGVYWDTLLCRRRDRRVLVERLDRWDQQVRQYWQAGGWSDVDEFLASRTGNVRAMLTHDWAAELPDTPPPIATDVMAR